MNSSRREQVVLSKEDFQVEHLVSVDLKVSTINSEEEAWVGIRLEMFSKNSKNSSPAVTLEVVQEGQLNKQQKERILL